MTDSSDTRMPRDDGAEDHAAPHPFWAWLRLIMRGHDQESALRGALDDLIEDQDNSPIAADERLLLTNIVKVHDRTVADAMVPRVDIVAIDIDTPFDKVVQIMSAEQHSRVPVYRETLDDIVGVIHVKDVLTALARQQGDSLPAIVRDMPIVAPGMKVLALLRQMRLTHQHMALVVDEYGGIDGLVTIEDLVEEIVGEIEDEHDVAKTPDLVSRVDGTLLADARMTINDFEDQVGRVLLPEERETADTLGGLLFSLSGRIPRRGEILNHSSGLEFEVLDADPRRVKRLRIKNLPPAK